MFFSECFKLCGGKIKNLCLMFEKNMLIGLGLGFSVCLIVVVLVVFNKFYDELFLKMELLEMMGELEGCILGLIYYDNVALCYLGGL